MTQEELIWNLSGDRKRMEELTEKAQKEVKEHVRLGDVFRIWWWLGQITGDEWAALKLYHWHTL